MTWSVWPYSVPILHYCGTVDTALRYQAEKDYILQKSARNTLVAVIRILFSGQCKLARNV